MEDVITWLQLALAGADLAQLARVVVLLVGGIVLGRLAGALVDRAMRRSGNRAFADMAKRATSTGILGLGVVAALEQLGLDLSVLVGAAGIVTVAVGFASQTSASNVISGLFLMLERSIDIGDAIIVGGVAGEVVGIGLLSVKLRTFDNRQVRIPNEILMKSQITNLSRFPIRRIDHTLVLGHGADLEAVERIMLDAAEAEPRVLQEPVPRFHISSIDEVGVRVVLRGWSRRETLEDVRTALIRRTLTGLQQAGVPFPLPRRAEVATG
jgi:small-conductance mechanosensitive channel